MKCPRGMNYMLNVLQMLVVFEVIVTWPSSYCINFSILCSLSWSAILILGLLLPFELSGLRQQTELTEHCCFYEGIQSNDEPHWPPFEYIAGIVTFFPL